jgi:hypothetical protein
MPVSWALIKKWWRSLLNLPDEGQINNFYAFNQVLAIWVISRNKLLNVE